MNVLLMTDKLVTGGAEMYFCKLENELDQVALFTAAAPGDLMSRIKHKNRFLELTRKNHMVNLLRLHSYMKKHDIDVLHANSLRLVFYGIVLKKWSRKPVRLLYTKHNVTLLEGGFQGMLGRVLNRHVEQIITVSQFEKNSLIQQGVEPDRVTTIYNGVDLRQFPFHEKAAERKTWKTGILARLSEEKNHGFFLQIADRLRDVEGLEFYIAGEGPEAERISAEIKTLGLSRRVKMIGHVEEPETFIQEMDVLMLTSKREVFPMVVIEAMATGTPILSIDKGGIGEAIIDGETGFLVSDFDIEAFSEKIRIAMSDEPLRRSIVHKARRKVENEFSMQQMISQTADQYKRKNLSHDGDMAQA